MFWSKLKICFFNQLFRITWNVCFSELEVHTSEISFILPSSPLWPPGVWRCSCLLESCTRSQARSHTEPPDRLCLEGRLSTASLVHSSAQQIWAEVDLKGDRRLIFNSLWFHVRQDRFFSFCITQPFLQKQKYIMYKKMFSVFFLIGSFLYDDLWYIQN